MVADIVEEVGLVGVCVCGVCVCVCVCARVVWCTVSDVEVNGAAGGSFKDKRADEE